MTVRGPKRLPSVRRLRELLIYRPESGELIWRDSGKQAGRHHTDQKGRVSVRVWVDRQALYVHRVAWKLQTHKEPPDQIDHLDGDAANNRWANLADGSGGKNRLNCAMSGHNKTSGFTGVSWCSQKKRWRVGFTLAGRTRHVGFFSELDEAVMSAMEARIEAGFSPRHGTGCFLAKHHKEVIGYE